MANETRSISTSGLTAPQWTAQVDGSLNMASRSALGRLIVTSGTGAPNAITATLLFSTGFSLQDGAMAFLVPVANNTGAATLNIEGAGAVAIRDGDGVALAAGTLVTDRMYLLSYDGKSGNEFWRIVSSSAVASSSVIPPYIRLAVLDTSDTFEAPYDLYARIIMIGPAGSGARISTTSAKATGGSGGETAIKDAFFMESGQQLDFTQGSPGAALSVSTTDTNGNDATASSLTGPNGLTMTAYGGKGGVQGTGSLTPPVGGTGDHSSDNGDLYFAGEDAPNATGTSQSASSGSCFGLTEAPATPAAYTGSDGQAARDVLDQISTHIGGFWPWLTRGQFKASAGLASTSSATEAGDPGCGSGAAAYGSDVATGTGAGGISICVIEYTKEIT